MYTKREADCLCGGALISFQLNQDGTTPWVHLFSSPGCEAARPIALDVDKATANRAMARRLDAAEAQLIEMRRQLDEDKRDLARLKQGLSEISRIAARLIESDNRKGSRDAQ